MRAGTGDVTCALLIAWIHKLENDSTGNHINQNQKQKQNARGRALLNAITTIQSMLLRVQARANKTTNDNANQKRKLIDLPIIQSKADIENPPISRIFGFGFGCNDERNRLDSGVNTAANGIDINDILCSWSIPIDTPQT